jgi:segregation and condensation protein B
MESKILRNIVEGALLASGQALTLEKLLELFDEDARPERDEIIAALQDLEADCRDRSFELKHTASGYRFQVRQNLAPWIARLWEEKPKKYSRALLETLVLIAYRQPITRGDIEQIRGVAVSSDLIRTLMEREWVRVVGHRDVPGRPALYATTRQFLDYFNLKSLEELPRLDEIRDLDDINVALDLGYGGGAQSPETPIPDVFTPELPNQGSNGNPTGAGIAPLPLTKDDHE